jgi:hypothetical protein
MHKLISSRIVILVPISQYLSDLPALKYICTYLRSSLSRGADKHLAPFTCQLQQERAPSR